MHQDYNVGIKMDITNMQFCISKSIQEQLNIEQRKRDQVSLEKIFGKGSISLDKIFGKGSHRL